MDFDERLLALIRRAAPTTTVMIELIAAMLEDFTPAQRHEVFASLNAAGVLGEPFIDPWVYGGTLSHGALVDVAFDSLRDVPSEGIDRLLTQVSARFPVASWVDLDERPSDIEAQVLTAMQSTNRLLVVPVDDRRLAPPFQFERNRETLLPLFSVQRTNQVLRSGQDPWGALSWWTSPNGWIGGRSPSDLVGTDEEEAMSQLAESVLAS